MKKHILVFIALFCFLSNRSYSIEYSIIDLGEIGSGSHTEAQAINDSGQIVGLSNSQAFLWTSGVMTGLGTLGGASSVATGINNSGQVVGNSLNSSGHYRAFIWDSVNGMVDIGTLGGDQSAASDINNSGKVVGWADLANSQDRAFIWDSSSGMTNLGTLGGDSSSASNINDSGKVVGMARTSVGYPSHAFIWSSSGGMSDLGTLTGTQSGSTCLNLSDQVVGFARLSNDDWHIFSWTGASGMQDFGIECVGWHGNIASINDNGLIVGGMLDIYDDSSAFIYDPATQTLEELYDLIDPSSGWDSLEVAYDVNNAGQIVGYGSKDGETRAFFLTPVPEPSVVGLFFLGIGFFIKKIQKNS